MKVLYFFSIIIIMFLSFTNPHSCFTYEIHNYKTGLNNKNLKPIEENKYYFQLVYEYISHESFIPFRIMILNNNQKYIVTHQWYDDIGINTGPVILSEEYSIFDIKILKKFKFQFDWWCVKFFCRHGKINILEYIKTHHYKVLEDYRSSNYGLEVASEYGHVDVLEWWKNSGIFLYYGEDALDKASSNGHIDVLNWWLNSGLQLKYSEKSIHLACRERHIDVLNWWLNSGLQLKYSEWALNYASRMGRIDILDWWKNSGLKLKYNEDVLMTRYTTVLDWFFNSEYKIEYSNRVLNHVINNYSVDSLIPILDWLKKYGLPLKYNIDPSILKYRPYIGELLERSGWPLHRP